MQRVIVEVSMKKILIGILVFVVALACLIGGIFLTMKFKKTKIAVKPYMESLDVNWDLSENKAVPYSSFIAGIKKKMSGSAKITNLKITNADRKGYKKLTYRCTFDDKKWKPSNSEILKVLKSKYAKKTGQIGDLKMHYVVDYNSGKSLMVKNDRDVIVAVNPLPTKPVKYTEPGGSWICFADIGIDVVVIYPEDYKGICIGVGGTNCLEPTQDDLAFDQGLRMFDKTSYYLKKNNCHFMKVSQ